MRPEELSPAPVASGGEVFPLSGGTVFMLPGQGSQRPGMGAGLAEDKTVRAVLACASEVFGVGVARLCTQADAEQLNDARNAQIAVCALSVGTAAALKERGVRPDAVLGFSLGQLGALAVAGMLSFEQMFRLVDVRSRVMSEVVREYPGAMSAFLKADAAAVSQVCAECAQDEVLVPANFNCPGQIVVSGSIGAIERAEEAWSARGGRFARLATAGGFHSPLMQPAVAPFRAFLETLDFSEPAVALVCNTDARCADAASIRECLCRHLVEPVRFEESVRALVRAGAARFVETGYGGVLCGLVRRIDKGAERVCVQDADSVEAEAERRGHER